VAEIGLRHGDDAPRDAAGIHQLAGQDEERHRQQREAVSAGLKILSQQLHVPEIQVPHQHRAGEQQREGDGHAKGHEAQQR
jgi:hypothetical protein